MFGVVWDYYSSKLKGKPYKQNTSPKSYEAEVKILANPGLAKSCFEQPSRDVLELTFCYLRSEFAFFDLEARELCPLFLWRK